MRGSELGANKLDLGDRNMTTLVKKVGNNILHSLADLKERLCNDGQFCDDVAMMALAVLTVWMMYVAMQPLM